MATYKKRGYKPKTKDDKRSAIEDQSTTAEVFNTLDEGASKTEEWVVKNQKYIFIIILRNNNKEISTDMYKFEF